MKRLLTLFGFLLALGSGAAHAQSIARVIPDSILVDDPDNFPWPQTQTFTIDVVVRGVHFRTDPADSIIEFRSHIPSCYVWMGVNSYSPPFNRKANNSTAVSLNDSTLRFSITVHDHTANSIVDFELVTMSDTIRKNKALKIQHRYFDNQTVTVTPAQARPGQMLDVVASNLTLAGQVSNAMAPIDQISSTLYVDLQQGGHHIVTNFSTLYTNDVMSANLSVPIDAKPGCYDVYINGYEMCQVLNDAFCVTPGVVQLPGRVRGVVYKDSLDQCYQNFDEPGLKSVLLKAEPGPYYAVTDSMGRYTMELPLDTFTISQVPSELYKPACPTGVQTVIVNGLVDGLLNFGDSVNYVGNLEVSMWQWGARPGRRVSTSVYVANTGRMPMNATLYVKLDTAMRRISSAPAPFAVRGDTLVYKFNNMAQWQSVAVYLVDSLRPDFRLMGDTLHCKAWVTGDLRETRYSDNLTVSNIEIRNSWDPNDKMVWPDKQFFATDSVLSYRIRFQNSGTDTAFVITVLDTLSEHLDVSSVISKGASHPHTFSIKGENVLEWRFWNILLPDSNVNEEASHGFIEFSIRRKLNLPMGTQIDNRAGIYFDFNPPVMTNYATTTLSMPVLVRGSIGTNGVTVYPNPMGRGQSILRVGGKADLEGAQFELTDMMGRRVATSAIRQGAAALERSRLKAGLYSFHITHKGKAASTGRLVLE